MAWQWLFLFCDEHLSRYFSRIIQFRYNWKPKGHSFVFLKFMKSSTNWQTVNAFCIQTWSLTMSTLWMPVCILKLRDQSLLALKSIRSTLLLYLTRFWYSYLTFFFHIIALKCYYYILSICFSVIKAFPFQSGDLLEAWIVTFCNQLI